MRTHIENIYLYHSTQRNKLLSFPVKTEIIFLIEILKWVGNETVNLGFKALPVANGEI